MPTLSVCLAVKNEAANLPRCLGSVAGLADEIVVVDTGSTDETVAVAEAHGARVFHQPWQDDFSAAFNAAFERATGDWLLHLDADEELVVSNADTWRRAIAGSPMAYALLRENVDAEGRPLASLAHIPRLVPNRPELRFEGRLHALLLPAIQRTRLPLATLEAARIRHHGYLDAALLQGDKLARNRRLNEAAVRERPDDPAAWFHLAGSLHLAGDWAGASVALAQIDRLAGEGRPLPPNLVLGVALLAAWVHQATGQGAAALAALEAGLARCPDAPELRFERGMARARQGDAAGAIADLEACLALSPEVGAATAPTRRMAEEALTRLRAGL